MSKSNFFKNVLPKFENPGVFLFFGNLKGLIKLFLVCFFLSILPYIPRMVKNFDPTENPYLPKNKDDSVEQH